MLNQWLCYIAKYPLSPNFESKNKFKIQRRLNYELE